MEINYQLNEIDEVAQKVLGAVSSKIIVLNGGMGVGKTTFVKALVKALGSNDIVSSPTFSIVNEYELNDDLMYHFDMYRIKDENEALQFGIEDYLSTEHWILIEWPEKIPNLLPKNIIEIDLRLNKDNSRTLKLNSN